MAAAAAAAGIDAVSSVNSLDLEDSNVLAGAMSAGLGPPTFGSSFTSDDDPYAWAQKLRRIPDKVCDIKALRLLLEAYVSCSTTSAASVCLILSYA